MTLTAESLLTVRTVGGLLPTDLLDRVAAGRDLPGLSTADYRLPAGTSPREAANRAWTESLGAWQMFRTALAALPEGDRATTLTRERWLGVLLHQLGFELRPTPAGGIAADDRAFPVSHLDGAIPIHLLGWNVTSLDQRAPGVAGAADKAPHAMVQELLNRSDDHLWALLSNGHTLRLLRDATSLVGQSYVEFDLEAMFDGEVFSDFVVLYLTCHRTRFQPIDPDNSPEDWLERWRNDAAETGTRALELLRDGVEAALTTFGTGFLRHPANKSLCERLENDELELRDYHRALLRLVYRLVFCFVAEDRGLILRPDAEPVAVDRYHDYFSTRRLRRVAQRRHGTRHADLWQTVTLLFELLGREQETSELGLGALGGLFEPGPLDLLDNLQLTNTALLEGIRHLSIVQPKGEPRRAVDFRNLGAEELGSIYESLLELVPRHDPETHTFTLDTLAGNERRRTGSYYTPTSLIVCLLDTALDPLLDRAEKSDDPESALLALTVCDPACGSGHFLVAAAKRIASRVARVRSGGLEPSVIQAQAAMRDVIAHCIYGVDIDPMAIELTKVGLWLEAVEPGRPLSFLDAHLRVGNSLLGTTPALLAAGIPDDAFAPVAGDDKKHATALKARNKRARAGQGHLPISNTWLALEAERLDALPTGSLEDVHVAGRRLREIDEDPQRRQATLLADLWCAAFVAVKRPDQPALTGELLDRWSRGLPFEADDAKREVDDLTRLYRFFHWHLEFPQIFTVPDDDLADTVAGWRGGFTCVVGNPPWEHVELKEQEFFTALDPDIAEASGAVRKRLIKALPETNPALHDLFEAARRRADGERHFLGASGRYPLCGRGRINTYAVFAETDRLLVGPGGRVGAVLPTGIATDATTQYFFSDLVQGRSLASLYDFENNQPLFIGVHRSFKFSLVTMTGHNETAATEFAFFLHHPDQLTQTNRRFALSADEIALLNPNTGTCPIFRSRRDAQITLDIYRRVPVLVNDADPNGNPWGASFIQGLFNMTTASHLFHMRDELNANGWHLNGNIFERKDERMLPLYQGLMVGLYDHRPADIYKSLTAQKRPNQPRYLSDDEKDDADRFAMPMYWVHEHEVESRLAGRWSRSWLVGFCDVTSPTNSRTLIAAVLPRSAVADKVLLTFPSSTEDPLLSCILSSIPCDYVVRQKLGGLALKFFTFKQLPILAPTRLQRHERWHSESSVDHWLRPRVVELTYTATDLAPFARDLEDSGSPFRWDPDRRAILRAEIDAAFFHLYGLDRDDTDYILGTFPIVNRKDVAAHGEERTRQLILENYDRMAAATSDKPFVSSLDPPPGQGARHPERGR
jgi:hypothetical protein